MALDRPRAPATPPNPAALDNRLGQPQNQTMSHQEAKAPAQKIIRDLLRDHPPGFVVMVIRALHKIQRSTPDLTIYAGPKKPEATIPPHPPRE